jgi:hypothetical protein
MNKEWFEDIKSWTASCNCSGCSTTKKDASRSYNINTINDLLLDEGWDSSKYTRSMKPKLHDYLTKWYFLAEKQMPKPATSLRRNPDIAVVEDRVDFIADRRQTTLSNGDMVRTAPKGLGYVTYIWKKGRRHHSYQSNSLTEAFLHHDDIIDEVYHG